MSRRSPPRALAAALAALALASTRAGAGGATNAAAEDQRNAGSAAASGGSPLAAALASALFYHSGIARAADRYAWVPFSVSYMEPDNVTAPNTGWGLGSFEYLYRLNETSPAPGGGGGDGCGASAGSVAADIPGNDLGGGGPLPGDRDNATACAALCCAAPGCGAFVYEPASDTTFGGCAIGRPCCFLKRGWGPTARKPPGFAIRAFNISGAPAPPVVVDPVIGIRSSPPLGGVSTGSIELRADGSFREWLIFNQGPAGSAKFALADDAWLAVSVGGVARVLRTAPPAYAAAAGVAALNFSGSYPLTRLVPLDAGLPPAAQQLALFAYSTFVPGDLAASAVPAIAFTLTVTNAGSAPLPVALALNMPLGGLAGCSMRGDGRGGDGGGVGGGGGAGAGGGAGGSAGAANASACLHACAAAPATCASWQFDAGACTLNSDVPLAAYSTTATCGLAGRRGWSAADGAASLDMRAPSGALGTSSGDVTLRAAADGDLAAPAAASFAAADDPAAVLGAFASGAGAFSASAPGLAAGGAAFEGAQAAHGAAAVAGVVSPGGTATFTVVFAWSFPFRNWNGGAVLGNGYSALFPDSGAAASRLATPAALAATVAAINAHHEAVAGPRNPAPAWLKDMLLNQFSHAHMLMWLADGRMREYEAYSCDDVDSVHNDFQRSRLYLWAFPEFEASKLAAWSGFAQAADGHVYESLAGGCGGGRPGSLDEPSGRLMGDTTSLFVVEVGELWHMTGDAAALSARWPAVARAVAWMMDNANATGLPRFLETTYDHFGFGSRESVVYNAMIFLASMSYAAEMAAALGEHGVAAAAAAALARAQAASTAILWNSTSSYYRAFSGGDAVFTDSLYGLMIAHAGGFGLAGVDAGRVASHLAVEWQRNADAFGMRVISNPVMEDSIWMNGPPTWSYHALAQLAASSEGGVIANASALAAALEPMRRMVANYRDRLGDLWNLRALTHSETEGSALEHGGPREQGHYGFMLTDLFLLPLLSGQQAALHAGRLAFRPVFAAPYALPVLLLGTEGALEADASGRLTLRVAFGSLSVPAGGLSVDGNVYGGGAVELGPGDAVSWTPPSAQVGT